MSRDLTIEKTLGEGTYGIVYKVTDKNTNKIYALKKTTPDTLSRVVMMDNEISILKYFKEKCVKSVLQFVDFWKENDTYYVLTEYIQGTNLSDFIMMMFRNERMIIAVDIADALKCVHSANVAHLDIKPDNMILTNSGTIKILDFGFACGGDDKIICKKEVGSPVYMAPEMIEESLEADIKTFQKADIYGFGTILFEIFNDNKLPFKMTKNQDPYQYIKNKTAILPRKSSSGIKAVDTLIDSMLKKNPADRPDIDVVYTELKNIQDLLLKK